MKNFSMVLHGTVYGRIANDIQIDQSRGPEYATARFKVSHVVYDYINKCNKLDYVYCLARVNNVAGWAAIVTAKKGSPVFISGSVKEKLYEIDEESNGVKAKKPRVCVDMLVSSFTFDNMYQMVQSTAESSSPLSATSKAQTENVMSTFESKEIKFDEGGMDGSLKLMTTPRKDIQMPTLTSFGDSDDSESIPPTPKSAKKKHKLEEGQKDKQKGSKKAIQL